MLKIRWWMIAALAFLLVAGCGDDDDDDVINADAAVAPDATQTPDAAATADAPDMPDAAGGVDGSSTDGGATLACDTFESPAATLTKYPATFAGDINDGVALVDISEMDCAVEIAPIGVGAPGFEQVIRLEGLVAGVEYGVSVTATYDTQFYVATACTGDDGPAMGECLVYVDTFADTETATFTQPAFIAPEDGVAFVVVDHWDPMFPPADGTYSLTVAQVGCVDHFDCTSSGEVVCEDFSCVAGPAACVGDDPSPPENDDDGPFGATALVIDTPASASVCNEPALESDFYVITAADGDDIRFELSWVDFAADLDFVVYDAVGTEVGKGFSSSKPEVFILTGAAAGDYYVQVDKFEDFTPSPTTTTVVTPYTLSATTPECLWDADCTTTGLPICSPASVCVAGIGLCTGDDAAENDDDGAGLGTPVTPPTDGSTVVLSQSICSFPSTGSPGSSLEFDWFAVTVADGTLVVTLDWAGGEDLDLELFDAVGALVDSSKTSKPEVLGTAVTAGTYYLRVEQFSPVNIAAAAPYTLTFSETL